MLVSLDAIVPLFITRYVPNVQEILFSKCKNAMSFCARA